MEGQNDGKFRYANQNASLEVFVQQSENSELIIGKVVMKVKKQMQPIKMLIEMKGIYKIWDSPKDILHQQTQNRIDIFNTSLMITEMDQTLTRSNDGIKLNLNHMQKLQKQEIFLEGNQKIAQTKQIGDFIPQKQFVYPFVFHIPQRLPPSMGGLWFAGKRIQIKYFLIMKGVSGQSQQPIINTQFEILIRQSLVQKPSQQKFCRTLKYTCFMFHKFCCLCLGTYHLELSSTFLQPGQIQIEGRIFRQGKKTEKIVSSLKIRLKGQLKNVQQLVIDQKKIVLYENQYEMFEGEVILHYDPTLRTLDSSLLTIRYWIECQVEFKSNIWKIKRKDMSSDIII